jgi:hypothetical protein
MHGLLNVKKVRLKGDIDNYWYYLSISIGGHKE